MRELTHAEIASVFGGENPPPECTVENGQQTCTCPDGYVPIAYPTGDGRVIVQCIPV